MFEKGIVSHLHQQYKMIHSTQCTISILLKHNYKKEITQKIKLIIDHY